MEQLAIKAMNCPGPLAGVRERGAQLSRSAAPASRADAAASQRSVRRAVGPHARTPVHQDDAHCFVTQEQIGEEVERLLGLVQRVYADFGLQFEAKLATRPPEFLGEAATWDSAEVAAQGGARAGGAELHGQRRRRRVLRAENRFRRHRRDRPEVAVRHDPARLPDAGSGSA